MYALFNYLCMHYLITYNYFVQFNYLFMHYLITYNYLQGHMAKNFYYVQDLGQNVSKIVSCIQQLNAGMSSRWMNSVPLATTLLRLKRRKGNWKNCWLLKREYTILIVSC